MSAALEFTRPLAGSSAATLIIFVPLAFLSGVTGAFFKALSVTMASALFVSFLVTWLAVPILCDRWLKPKDAEEHTESRFAVWMNRRYASLIERVTAQADSRADRPDSVDRGGGAGFCAGGQWLHADMDEGGFVLDYHTEPGTSITETDRLMRQVEAIIRANPNVATYSRRTGAGLGGDLNEPNRGDFFVRLKAEQS